VVLVVQVSEEALEVQVLVVPTLALIKLSVLK
jgi:hypothetical protein